MNTKETQTSEEPIRPANQDHDDKWKQMEGCFRDHLIVHRKEVLPDGLEACEDHPLWEAFSDGFYAGSRWAIEQTEKAMERLNQ